MINVDSPFLFLSLDDDGADIGARVSRKVDQGVGLLEGNIALQDAPAI